MALIQSLGVQTLVSLMAAERRGARGREGSNATQPVAVIPWLHDSRAASPTLPATGSSPAAVGTPACAGQPASNP
jgi:hypothetical protein